MTIFSKTVKLANDINPLSFIPDKTGVDIVWKRHEGDLWATFIAGNVNNEHNLAEAHDINRQLSKLKVIQDSIKDYKTYKKVVPPDPKMIVWHNSPNGLKIDK